MPNHVIWFPFILCTQFYANVTSYLVLYCHALLPIHNKLISNPPQSTLLACAPKTNHPLVIYNHITSILNQMILSISGGFSTSKTTLLPFFMVNFTQTFNLNQPHLLFFCRLVIYTLWYSYHLHKIFVIGISLWDLCTCFLWHDFCFTSSHRLLDFILLIWHQWQH